MAILVAGGAGYIGSHTCVELLNRGYEVVVIDNLYNSSEVALERVKEITGKSLKFYKGDILSREDLEKIFDNEEIEAVINFAGLKAVGESVAKPWEYYHKSVWTDKGDAGTDPDRPACRGSGVECHAAPLLQSDRGP